MIFLDFETRSRVNLKTVGTSVYARHPSTEVLCLAWGRTPVDIEIWTGGPMPQGLADAVYWGVEPIEAHNVFFERNIWHWICHKRFGWPDVKFENWRCSLAACSRMTLPRGLGDAGNALGLDTKKDDAGHKLMMRLCKPLKEDRGYDEDPAKLQRLYEYCKQDVRAEMAIAAAIDPLAGAELKVWQLDQRINLRGLAVDRAALKTALRIVEESQRECSERIKQITGGKVQTPKQVMAIRNLIEADMGAPIPDLAKDTVDEWLGRDDLTPLTREILEIRKVASKASTAKLTAMLDRCDADGRVRSNLVYHGAATGRWAGAGIQIQNFPRGTLSPWEIEIVHEVLPSGDGERLDLLLGPPIDCISSSLRSMIVAEHGKRLLVCDFASIEARVLAWLAGETDLLALFAANGDTYKAMASKIYEVEESDVTKPQRQLGKTAILGCFEADTLVLTDEGWIPIVEVNSDHLLWDGEAWVRHTGVICQGRKTVLRRMGVGATPDHLCLTTSGWKPWESVVTSRQDLRMATSSVNLPFWAFDKLPTRTVSVDGIPTRRDAVAERFNVRCGRTSTTENRHGATNARRSPAAQRGIGNTSPAWMTTSTVLAFSTDCRLRLRGATTLTIESMKGMAEGASVYAKSGEIHGLPSSLMYSNAKAGTTRILKWIESITTGAMSLGTFGLYPVPTTWRTEEPFIFYSSESRSLKPRSLVYDVTNCGPRNRFTILTTEGPLIVHNCGYGMGYKAFQAACKVMAGIEIDRPFAKKVIKAYREANPHIRQFWSDLNTACIRSIETQKPHRVGRLEVSCDGDWMRIKLPSNRQLHYRKPELVEVIAPWSEGYEGTIRGPETLLPQLEELGIEVGTEHVIGWETGHAKVEGWLDCNIPKGAMLALVKLVGRSAVSDVKKKEPQYIKQIQHWGVNSLTKKWSQIRTYGGKLVENVTQAVARDFLAEAMVRVENKGYEIVASVHDEILCERTIGEGSLEEFEQLMRVVPRWGNGCPIEVEGFEERRYRK